MKAYKVVFTSSVGQLSSISFNRGHPACVFYEPGKPALPRKDCGPLAAFDTLKNAWIFATIYFPIVNYSIWKCKVKTSSNEMFYIPKDCKIAKFPRGTVFCSQITLTKDMKDEPIV